MGCRNVQLLAPGKMKLPFGLSIRLHWKAFFFGFIAGKRMLQAIESWTLDICLPNLQRIKCKPDLIDSFFEASSLPKWLERWSIGR